MICQLFEIWIIKVFFFLAVSDVYQFIFKGILEHKVYSLNI